MKSSFGTPSYPSPLDRIRTGKRERAAQLGLSVSKNRRESFEGNQSFPKLTNKNLHKGEAIPDTPDIKKTLQDFKGKTL